MLPVAVQVAAVLASGVEDAEDDSFGVGLDSLLEVADGDAAVHPLAASSKAAPANPRANPCVALVTWHHEASLLPGTAARLRRSYSSQAVDA